MAVAHGQRKATAASVFTGLRRAIDVLLALTFADLRARYGRGSVRLFKWLFDPFAVVGVYLFLVTLILDRPGPAPGLSLACAVVAFQIVVMTIINSMDAIRQRASIVLNMGFRRELIPLSSTLTESAAFSSSMALLALMMGVYGLEPTPAILWLPLVVAINLVFAAAIAYPLTLIGIWYQEMRPFVVSLARAMFFAAPSLVPLSQVGGGVSDWIKLNPLTGLFEGYRDALLYGQAPAAWELLYPLGFSIALLALFVPIFRREQWHIAKLI